MSYELTSCKVFADNYESGREEVLTIGLSKVKLKFKF